MISPELKDVVIRVEECADRAIHRRSGKLDYGVDERREAATRLARAALRMAAASEDAPVEIVPLLYRGSESALWMSTLALANEGGLTGECRRATPFAPLRLVLTEGGARWCCLHDPEHCDR